MAVGKQSIPNREEGINREQEERRGFERGEEKKVEQQPAAREVPAGETREEIPQREIERIREKEKIPEKKQKVSGKPKKSKKQKDDLYQDLQSIMSMDKPKQIKALVYISFKKGIKNAVAVAKQLDDPYLLDEFHDTLVDELYDYLVKKKKLKQFK